VDAVSGLEDKRHDVGVLSMHGETSGGATAVASRRAVDLAKITVYPLPWTELPT
jgi:hypothetical protein